MGTDEPAQRNNPTYRSFETSAAIIKRAGWKIRHPMIENIPDEASAQAFIKTLLRRDKRQNQEESRFRLLCIKVDDRSQIPKQQPTVDTAAEARWINSEFGSFIQKGTVGSAVLTETGDISLIVQTPDDDLPFLTLSMREIHTEGRQRRSDWVCLFFIGPDIDLESLLHETVFPSDYSPLSPDFMFLPVRILKNEVEQVGRELKELKKLVLKGDDRLLSKDLASLDCVKNELFELGKTHLKLRDRWLFAKGLAENLVKCFSEIARLQEKDIGSNSSSSGSKATYSKILMQRVETQMAMSDILQLDLDAIPPKIKQQHKTIDTKLSIMIAEDTRRDSSSMKTIAVLTLVFLPATAMASIFSMSMLDWQAKDGDTVVSSKIWIYAVVAVVLTCVVLVVWILWFKWTQKKYDKKMWNDIETADNPNSKETT
ncbi:hypothetical protein L207DRAFT_522437 [Hyaloscypha variabilis F]|uniref:Uncharacterized protein n=1 Tax=Hyaloscypha variabilis (strain UAMH 11265 / GT02V1 / F) TaxID=1149755 RepID=A0A2J6S885_HYAVF|nr:hypothetical protein L207DRAFT_522437 [Hyaloscypha variabilis F]